MLEGEFTVWVGKNKVVLGAGESTLIPIGTPHVVAALSVPTRGLVIASPSAFAHLIEATATLNENDAFDLELFNRISSETGDEILGAPGDLP